MQSFLVFSHELFAKNVKKSRYRCTDKVSDTLIHDDGYVSTMRDGEYEKSLNREPVKYRRKPSSALSTDTEAPFDEERNKSVLSFSAGGVDGIQCTIRILLSIKITLRVSNEGPAYLFLEYIRVTRPIHMVVETIRFVCLWWYISEKVGHG